MYEGVGLQLHTFLNFGIREVSGQPHASAALPLGSFAVTNRLGGSVGPKALWVFGKGKGFLFRPEIEPRFFSCPTRACPNRYAYCTSCAFGASLMVKYINTCTVIRDF